MNKLKLIVYVDCGCIWSTTNNKDYVIDVDYERWKRDPLVDNGKLINVFITSDYHLIMVIEYIMEKKEYNRMKLTNGFPKNYIHFEIL